MTTLIGLWVWRGSMTAVVTVLLLLYYRGWRQQPPQRPYRALALFSTSLGLLFITLATPFHQFASQYFFMRTAQHLLLIAWIPALLLASDPWPLLWVGLPSWAQERWHEQKRPSPIWQSRFRFLTAPGTIWLILICSFWLWYDPTLHQATLTYPWLRSIEIISLFIPALLYWWHVTGATPHRHNQLSLIARVVLTIAATMPIKIVGLILLFVPETVYVYPRPLIAGFVFDAESLGGVIVWVLGGIVYSWTAVYLMRQWLADEDKKPTLPAAIWDTEEAMLAPGLRSHK